MQSLEANAITEEHIDMFSLFELTPDLVCITGKDGYFRKINPAVIKTLGYTHTELMSKPVSTFIHPHDVELTARERKKLLEGNALLNLQNRYCTKNGEIIWLEWTSVYLPAKEIVFAIAKNITARKQVELEIVEQYKKYKSLASHFKNSIESDRKLLAIELHEELAQLASVVKVDLDVLKADSSSLDENFIKRLEHANVAAGMLINTIRRISFSISPNMLDDVGFDEAMNWLCHEFKSIYNLPTRFVNTVDEALLPKNLQLDIFRICQQTLSSVLEIAVAKNVCIHFTETKDGFKLCISDEGRGLDGKSDKHLYAINTLKQRVASVNGEFKIVRDADEKTKICIQLAME